MKELKIFFLAIGILLFPSIVSAQAGTAQTAIPGCWAQVIVTPMNKCSLRLTILTAPFEGLALKSAQVSKKKTTLCTGEYIFAGRYDQEQDDVSTGRKFGYVVFDKIIVEGQDSLVFTDYDLKPVGKGKALNKVMQNDGADKYTIIGGSNEGEVIPSYSQGVSLALNKGWNILVLQYLDAKGLPTQAVVLFMCSDDKKPMVIKRDSERKSRYNPDGLVITDWQKPETKK